jgi:hypothetical protein
MFARTAGLAIVAYASCAFCSPVLAEDSFDARAKWVKGHQQKYTMEVDRTFKTMATDEKAVAFEQAQTIKQTIGVMFRIADVQDDVAVVYLTYTDINMTLVDPTNTYSFDSRTRREKDSDNQLAGALRPLVGATITLRLNKAGEITGVGGNENYIAPGRLGQFAQQLAGTGALRNRWGPLFATKPGGGPVKPGESWTKVDDIDGGSMGVFKLSTTTTMESIESGIARAVIAGTFELPAKEGETQMFSVKESEYEGRTLWNTADGLIDTAETKQKVGIAGAQQQGMALNVETETKVTMYRGEPKNPLPTDQLPKVETPAEPAAPAAPAPTDAETPKSDR